jgi:RNA polymerase sigma-54 factor
MLMVDLYRQRSNRLYINQGLMETVQHTEGRTAEEKSTVQNLKSKLTSAMWFINAIKQREDNMLRIVRTIVKKQRDYFLTGDESNIKPIILKNIADEVGLDISTISRVTCNKYIDTPFGYILLKNLFTEGIINEEGVSVSNRVVQIKLKEIIDAEDKMNPYNDQHLVTLLEERGIKIARRTVAKYRDLLNIPVGEMRRIWAKAI